jgi:hypothetical protein
VFCNILLGECFIFCTVTVHAAYSPVELVHVDFDSDSLRQPPIFGGDCQPTLIGTSRDGPSLLMILSLRQAQTHIPLSLGSS